MQRTDRSNLEESEGIRHFTKWLGEHYSLLPRSDDEKNIGQLERFILKTCDPRGTPRTFLQRAAEMIALTFGISEISVALLDETDKMFRFVAFVGVKKEDQLAHERLSYTAQDLFSPTAFPRIKLDNYVEFFLEEFRPYKKGELDTFGAKDRSGIPRDQDMELLREGDYMDVYFFSPPTRVLGWFEIVRTVDGKIPSRENLKWLECFAQVAGRIAYEMERRKR